MKSLKLRLSDGSGMDYITVTCTERDHSNPFSSGSVGFFAGGKFELEGKRYQMTCSLVEIGSKPVPKN